MDRFSRRNIELILLLIASPIMVLLFAMLSITQGEALGLETLGVPLGLFAAFLLAHLAVRKFAPLADPAVLPISFALAGIGIAFVTRLDPTLAPKQVIWLYVSIACMVLVLALVKNLDFVARYKYTFMIAAIVLLLSPMLPFVGKEINGSRIWLALGPLSFQPGELAKICIALSFAGYLAANREELSIFTWSVGPFKFPSLRTLMPLLFMWLLATAVVILEKDLGSAVVLFSVFLVMLYNATGKKFYIVISWVCAGIAAIFLWCLFSHVQVRIATWINPFADAQDTGYQLVQAIYSMADGGLFGTGIGNGLATLIPVASSDFIFAAIAEEAGLLGAAGVLLLYICFAVRGFLISTRATSDVSSLIATGITAAIVIQAFIIVGGVTRLIPLTGLTLPFMSQGGSSLLASFIIVALLLRCSDTQSGVEVEMKRAAGHAGHALEGTLGRAALGRRIRNTLIFCSVLFAALVINLTNTMVVQASTIQQMEGNNHTIIHEQKTQRGDITTSDGVVLATSVLQDDGTYKRTYPQGSLAAHTLGYVSLQYGTSGIEKTENTALMGKEDFASFADAFSYLLGKRQAGNTVELTLDSSVQRKAEDVLTGYNGACLVLDASTGATLALASSPTYDVNNVESILNGTTTNTTSELYNRATQALYAPGSTFKIVSLAAALKGNVATEETMFSAPGTIEIGGGTVTNFNKRDYGIISLARATEVSSNTVYGQLGSLLGPNALVSMAESFGFNNTISYDLPVTTSLMPKASEMIEWETAWAAAGVPVGEHASPAGPQTTVLQMAMVACSLANGGSAYQPYLVNSIKNNQGQVSYTASPVQLSESIDASTAARVTKVLEGVVTNGTGTAAQISGVTVAGKTGTAEKGTGKDDSWFVGYATVNGHSVVVALVVENVTSSVASPLAKQVLTAALQAEGML